MLGDRVVVASTKSWPLCPQERPGTHCQKAEGLVAGLDGT
jgi:hypothetical protein